MGFWLVTILSFLGYLATLAPGLTWAHDGVDGGGLAAAVHLLGIPHPPGYPTYVLLARAFTRPPFGSLAWRMNLFSAVSASLAVGLTYLAIRRLLRSNAATPAESTVLAGVAALSLAFSPTLWSQAVITEVYALHAAFAAFVLLCLVQWEAQHRSAGPWPELAAIAFGVGLGSHLTLLFIGPAAILVLARNSGLARSRWVRLGLLALLGMGVYAYLPWRARAWPPINWGNPQSLSGLWWQVSGGPYRQYAFGLPLSFVPARLAAWASLLGQQFGPVGLTATLLGAWAAWQSNRRFAIALAIYYVLTVTYALGYNTTDSYVYLIPSYLVCTLWLAMGLLWSRRNLWTEIWGQRRWAVAASAMLLAIMPGLSWNLNHQALSLRTDHAAQDYAATTFRALKPDAIVFADEDRHVFALWYYRYAEELDSGVTVLAEGLLSFPWYGETLRRNGEVVNLPATPNLADVVAANLARRPVYVTTPHPELAGRFRLRRLHDGLYRVEAR